MRTLSIDIETYSDVDLSKCGVYKYASSPVFEILLFGYAVDGKDVRVVDLACGEQIPDEIISALSDASVTKWAFNAMFERVCLSNFLGEWLEPEGWHCTMVWSATLGLPLSLESVGSALGLEKQKLTEGKDLIRYFCVPCKPTKANGGRIRNRPEHDTEKWERFKAYNLRDVETEMQIQKRLSNFPVLDAIWEEYQLDQEINDRGIGVDMELVRQTIAVDTRSRERLTAAMQELTGLENPNSVRQMKQWLADHGLGTDTLGKKAVAELVKTAPEPLREVLLLRQQLAKSSVKKYTAMENAVCADSRAHGMFQFYGANRTGRFSGRLIQLQNLPQNHMSDLAQARALVHGGDYEALSLLYEDIPDTLSQLIRTAFVPQDGRKFIVADFSAIEARVIAWFAGEVPSAWGLYVQTKSKVKLTINGAAGSYGSTIKSYSITGGGYSGSASTLTTGFLNNSGTITFKATVTDSRGRVSAEASVSITVTAYSPPYFNSSLSQRCLSNGTLDDDGTYIHALVSFGYSTYGGKNTLKTSVQYKQVSAEQWTDVGVTFASNTVFTYGKGQISTETSYDVRYTLEDAFSSISVQEIVSTAAVVMDFKSGGKGVAIGKVSESDNTFEVAENWDVKVYGMLLKEYIQQFAKTMYPVGSIYMSTKSANPSTYFGGTWVAWGSGRVPVGINTSDSNFNTVEKTGGASTVALTTAQMPSHSHAKGSLVTASAGAHTHNIQNQKAPWGLDDGGNRCLVDATSGYTAMTNKTTTSGGEHTHTISGSTATAGSGSAHNNLQPYIVCYMWKRMA